MRPVDYTAAIGRTQDISPIKQAEDARPMVEQQNITQSIEKQVEARPERVYEREEADKPGKFDASQGGRGTYQESNRKRKEKKEEDGKVIIKGHATFDVKI